MIMLVLFPKEKLNLPLLALFRLEAEKQAQLMFLTDVDDLTKYTLVSPIDCFA
jgi:hypothetical protein